MDLDSKIMKTIKLSIIGFGAVGQGVARVLKAKQNYLINAGINIVVVAITDSHGAYIDPAGVDLKAALNMKKESGSIATSSTSDMSSIDVIRDIDHDIMEPLVYFFACP